jgi:hypothetical protein
VEQLQMRDDHLVLESIAIHMRNLASWSWRT